MTEELINNQKINKKGRGGARPGAGRKQGAIQKLGGVELLAEIQKVTGKSFARSIAEHYLKAETDEDWNAVRDYEKFILNKVLSDKQEVDITSNGNTVGVAVNIAARETGDVYD